MNIIKELEYFKPIQKENYVEVIIPVAIKIFKACLRLRIYNKENGYVISDDGYAFYDSNEDSEYYYDLYKKNNKYHYNILLKDNYFYKEYESNFNINVALNEFVRLFIYLDDFVNKRDSLN